MFSSGPGAGYDNNREAIEYKIMLIRPEKHRYYGVKDCETMWNTLQVVPDEQSIPAVNHLIEQACLVFANGTTFSASFHLGESEILDAQVAFEKFVDFDFPHRLFLHPVIRKTLETKWDFSLQNDRDPAFVREDPLTLDGILARWLSNGGAYKHPQGSPADMKRLASDAITAWIGERFVEVIPFLSQSAWCDFYHDIAWDFTLVLLDKRTRKVHMICSTDTD